MQRTETEAFRSVLRAQILDLDEGLSSQCTRMFYGFKGILVNIGILWSSYSTEINRQSPHSDSCFCQRLGAGRVRTVVCVEGECGSRRLVFSPSLFEMPWPCSPLKVHLHVMSSNQEGLTKSANISSAQKFGIKKESFRNSRQECH